MALNRRKNDLLRLAINEECAGVMPHIADRIRRAAVKAYWMGVADTNDLHKSVQVCDNTSRIFRTGGNKA